MKEENIGKWKNLTEREREGRKKGIIRKKTKTIHARRRWTEIAVNSFFLEILRIHFGNIPILNFSDNF